jgi:hypothetical protein
MLTQILKINCQLTKGSCQVAGGLPGLGGLEGLVDLGRVRKVLPQITSKVNNLVDRTLSNLQCDKQYIPSISHSKNPVLWSQGQLHICTEITRTMQMQYITHST